MKTCKNVIITTKKKDKKSKLMARVITEIINDPSHFKEVQEVMAKALLRYILYGK